MEKTLRFYIILLFTVTSSLFSQNVVIPDANFKAYLVGNTAVNTNGDSEIQELEAASFTGTIYPIGENIADLTGIEAFVNITGLHCNSNQLINLNVSQNLSLTTLICNNNQLTNLDVSQNTLLTTLNCSGNLLTSLDVSLNTSLSIFKCNDNLLTNLGLGTNIPLNELYCQNNQLTSLDIDQNATLTDLRCFNNQLTGLDVNQNTSLEYLLCADNQLTSLNLNQNTSLGYLNCYNNQLTSLNLNQSPLLTGLLCGQNQLTILNLSSNVVLTQVGCGDNQLINLNLQNGNNTNVTHYYSLNNPNLTCIQVDDAAYSTTNWTDIDPASTFVNNQVECNALATENYELNNSFSVYPNPTSTYINVSYDKQIDKIEVYNILGKKVLEVKKNIIPTNSLTNGVYFIKLYTQNKLGVKQFIKQ